MVDILYKFYILHAIMYLCHALRNVVCIFTYYYSLLYTCKYYIYTLYFDLPVVSFLSPTTLLTVVAFRCRHRQHYPNRRFVHYHPIPRRLSSNARHVSTACSFNSALFTDATTDDDTVPVLYTVSTSAELLGQPW